MKYPLKLSVCAIIINGILFAGLPIQGNSVKTRSNKVSTRTRNICCGQVAEKRTIPRWKKLQEKHSRELRLLKDIHKIQLNFLKQFNGKSSQVAENDRKQLKAMLDELPPSVKKSDFPYLEQMAFIEYTVYSILNGKEKYESKKTIIDPEKILKDIQKKQLVYLVKLQKRENKRLKK